MNWVKVPGKIIYDPSRPGIKKMQRATPWWVIVDLDDGITHYYRWWLKKMKGVIIHPPAWGVHMTVLDGRKAVPKDFMGEWKKHQGKIIEIEYCVEFEQHWKFFVLPARCQFLEDLRKGLGFIQPHPFHITFGRLD